MKISRKRLRKIINEFLDTSRPMIDQPIPDLKDLSDTSVYDQLTNSERAAFISAMGVAGDAGVPGTNQELNEGDVLSFRRPPTILTDDDGDITPDELRDADLAAVHHLPPTPEEEESLQRKITTSMSRDRRDEEDELEAAIEMLVKKYQEEKRHAKDLASQGVDVLPSRFMRDADADYDDY